MRPQCCLVDFLLRHPPHPISFCANLSLMIFLIFPLPPFPLIHDAPPILFIICPPFAFTPSPLLIFSPLSLFLLSRCFLLPPFDCQVWGKNWIVIRRQSQRPLTRIPIHTPPPRRVSEIRLILLFPMRNLTMEIFFIKMFSSFQDPCQVSTPPVWRRCLQANWNAFGNALHTVDKDGHFEFRWTFPVKLPEPLVG